MSELRESTAEHEGGIWQERTIARAKKPALAPLEDHSLLAHLVKYNADQVSWISESGQLLPRHLWKAEIYLHPDHSPTFHAKYHELHTVENLGPDLRIEGRTGQDRKRYFFPDDTKTLSNAAVAYAINNSHDDYIEPFAYVFDAAKLQRRGYGLHSYIEGKAGIAEVKAEKRDSIPQGKPESPNTPANDIIGRINLPTQWNSKADEKLRWGDLRKNAQNSHALFVRSGDMFLVGEKLVPAECWLRLNKKERAEHMAPKQAIV